MIFVIEDSKERTVHLNMDIVNIATYTKEPSIATFYFDHYTVIAEDLEVTDTNYEIMEVKFKCKLVNINRIKH